MSKKLSDIKPAQSELISHITSGGMLYIPRSVKNPVVITAGNAWNEKNITTIYVYEYEAAEDSGAVLVTKDYYYVSERRLAYLFEKNKHTVQLTLQPAKCPEGVSRAWAWHYKKIKEL